MWGCFLCLYASLQKILQLKPWCRGEESFWRQTADNTKEIWNRIPVLRGRRLQSIHLLIIGHSFFVRETENLKSGQSSVKRNSSLRYIANPTSEPRRTDSLSEIFIHMAFLQITPSRTTDFKAPRLLSGNLTTLQQKIQLSQGHLARGLCLCL